jgi:hypothetical protein
MPTCQFQTIAWNEIDQPYGVTVACGQPATHRLDLRILGAGGAPSYPLVAEPGSWLGRMFFYCCGHNREALAEVDEHSAVEVQNDVVLDAAIRTELSEHGPGQWRMRLHVKHHGQAETATPWMRLAAVTEHGATLEAAARSAVIQSNVMGDHR